MRILLTACAAIALAACNQGDTNGSLEDANASGNAAGNAIENAVANSTAAPLEKKAALALMKERHENYEKIGKAMKSIGRTLKSETPDLAVVRNGADTIATLAPQVKGWFPAGTGPDVGKTEAKAEIWRKTDDFNAKADSFARAAQAFQATARGGDLAAIRAAQGDLGKSCKACHDLYREEL